MKNTTYGKKYGKKTAKPTVKNNAPKGPQMPKEWLYLAEDEITPAQIYGLFAEEKSWKAEYAFSKERTSFWRHSVFPNGRISILKCSGKRDFVPESKTIPDT